ncbi:MAG: extracellular solute-binding protein [Lachnospiraceae bacterium]|nr:extracellular solute-binding protein [Lachnospiraceae bacterium]
MILKNFRSKTTGKRLAAGALAFLALFSACAKNDINSGNRQTVTVMTIEFNSGKSNSGEHAREVMKRVEDYCGCNLSIEWVNNDEMNDYRTLAFSSPQSMPMIMTYGGVMTGDVVSAAKKGLFVNLDEYIHDEKKYPNLSKIREDVADSLSVDGKLIAIPRTRVVGRYGLCYRTDWAERLGLEEPSTPEAVYEMLRAFTYDDPDGNGLDDTIGLEMTSYTGVFDIIQTWFGCGNGWAEVDGKLIPVHMQMEYIDALDYIKKLYDDGLMPADWAVRPTETWSDGCKSGVNGVFIDVMDSGRRIWDYFNNDATWTGSVTDPSAAASMTLYGAVNGRTLATSGYNGYFTLSSSTCDTPEKIEAALTLLDRLCDDEMLVLTQYGIEGIHYMIDDEGYIEKIDPEKPSLHNDYAGFNQLLAYLPSAEHVPEPHVKASARQEALNEAYAAALEHAVINPAATYLVNSATYAEVGASLQDMVDEARTQYILGEISKVRLISTHQKWLEMGGAAIIEEVNANR